jgi:L-galactose dehydrogenase/L-glyceraldehyde 3-phosphate reductase
MKTRRFGRTGLQVSELVFGGGYVGGILILADDDTRRKALRRAFDAGINWIDTAPLYGQGKSEEALGWLLNEFPERPYLSTKVNVDDHKDIRGDIERSMHASLKRLGRDSVDLLQLHNRIAAEAGPNRTIGIGEVLDEAIPALERMREQGLARFIGLTALGETPAILRAIDSDRFDSAQVYYNALNPSAARRMPAQWSGQDFAGVIDACKRADMAIMDIRVFASGVLATDVRHGREVVLSENSGLDIEQRRARAVFATLGNQYGTRAQTAVRFALAHPDLSCVVIGLAELAHLEEAVAAQAMGPLPRAAIERLDAAYESGLER